MIRPEKLPVLCAYCGATSRDPERDGWIRSWSEGFENVCLWACPECGVLSTSWDAPPRRHDETW